MYDEQLLDLSRDGKHEIDADAKLFFFEASRFSDHPEASWCMKRSRRVSYAPIPEFGRHGHQKVSSFSLDLDGIDLR
jgi:hypothetical protein